jgi:hypothetical protein
MRRLVKALPGPLPAHGSRMPSKSGAEGGPLHSALVS